VNQRFDVAIGRIIGACVDQARRRSVVVVLLALLGAASSLFYSANHLAIEGETDQLFSGNLPFKQAERRYRDSFPAQYENIFVVVDAVTPERAGEAAAALLAAFQAEPSHFEAAYLPGGGEFFEEHAFLYLETAKLEDLADRLAENQPYLAELSRDGSLYGLTSMMERGARAIREGDVSGTRMRPMMDHFADALDAVAAGESFHLSWAEVLSGNGFESDARRRFLLVQPVLDRKDLQPAKQSILAVRRIADELGLTPAHGVHVRITGDVALSYEEMEVVRNQAATAGLASLALVGAILFFALRSPRMVLSVLLTLVVGLIYTAGFTAVAIGRFNLISVAFAVLFIGLGVDFGIHLMLRYRELMSHGRSHASALRSAAEDIGGSLSLCATTTAIGFFAFVPTAFVGVAELGLISGVGMFISLLCTVTVLPALISLPPVPARAIGRHVGSGTGAGLANLPLRNPRAVRASAIVLGVAAIVLLPEARFDNNPLHVRDPASESVRTFKDLLESGGGLPYSVNAVAPNLKAAEAIAAQLRQLDEVGRVVTVSDFIPSDQEEKLGIIEDVAMFIAPQASNGNVTRVATPAQQVTAFERLEAQLSRLALLPPAADVAASAERLRGALERFRAHLRAVADPAAELARLENGLLGSLPEQLRMLEAALGAGRVALENLPDALLTRMMTADGHVRIQIFPREDLSDQASMAAFVDAVRKVEPDVAGSASEIVESGRAVVAALRQALLSAILVITLFLLVMWRRIDDTALVMVPLGLAAVLTVAAAVLLDIPFNFADVIVLPLLLGIGVDYGIHLVHRARTVNAEGVNLLGTSTARAVGFSALTTIGSFGTMGLATHLGLATLGRLLTLGVTLTVLCNLLLLPALIALHGKGQAGADRSREAA